MSHKSEHKHENKSADPDAAAANDGKVSPAATPTDLQKLQQERDSLYERLARATADYQNSRRRLETEFDQRLQYANSALIKSLLPVIDNFERAMAVDQSKAEPASILKGMQIVHDQWLTVLKNQFVETLAPEPGTPFSPATMEAIVQEPSDQYKEPTVTKLLQKGYALHGRTLRPAQVAVSKSPS